MTSREIKTAFELLLSEIEKERSSVAKSTEQLKKERESFEEEKRKMIKIAIKDSDVLNLNVGGEKISVKRSTLTQIKDSLLESMFSGRWEDSLERDQDGNIFLEFNPYCFKKLVDYLRAKRIETPDRPAPKPIIIADQQAEFINLVAYLGLATELKIENNEKKNRNQ